MQFTSSSTKNLRIRSPSITKSPSKQSPSKQKMDRKRQIETTLNELHQLQSQIYDLNVNEQPHSSGPVKKEIKQLSFLYEDMTKPKMKNSLNVDIKEIRSSIKIINQGINAIQSKQKYQNVRKRTEENEISLFNNLKSNIQLLEQSQSHLKISKKTLKELMKSMFGTQFDLSVVSESKTSNITELTAEQIQKFINYNQHDQFEPLRQSYKSLMDENNQFSFKKYNEMNKILGLPMIKDVETLKVSLGLKEHEQITYEVFKGIIESEIV